MEAESRATPWWVSMACESGSCVEVAVAEGVVYVRDGKDPHGAMLRFTAAEWAAFLQGVKAGQFDGTEF